MCLLTFFCLLSAEKLLTGDEKHRKKRVVSSLWYTEALPMICACACMYHIEKKVPDEQQA